MELTRAGAIPSLQASLLPYLQQTDAFSDFVTTGNDLAILGNGPSGVDIFEIGSGACPIKLSTFDTPGSVRKAALTQDYLAIADAEKGLTILDIIDPEAPSLHLSINQESPANAIAVDGKIAYLGWKMEPSAVTIFKWATYRRITLGCSVDIYRRHGLWQTNPLPYYQR